MRRSITAGFALSALMLANSPSFSNVGSDLDGFFNGLGYESNTTMPNAYTSQAAGSYGSGSLYVRNQVRQFQLVQLDLPSYRAGCGGIDLYTGSLSFLSGDNLKNLGRSVMSNAAAYAFDVGLSVSLPELKQIKDNLVALEQKVNQSSINSCEAAKSLVGGLWPKTQASQEKICKDQGTMGDGGLFSDYVTARMECAGSKFDDAIREAKEKNETKEQVVLDKNIVWSLLKEKSAITDNQMLELIMSLTGTIIIDKDGHVTNVPSLIKSKDLIQALLGRDDVVLDKDGSVAGNAQIWGCKDNEKCMSVQLKKLTIDNSKTLRHRVSTLIQGLYQHVKEDKEPTTAEKNLVAMSHIPIMRFITVLASTDYGVNAVDLNDYASLIAQDMLTQYLSELLQEAHNVTVNSTLNQAIIDSLEGRIKSAQAEVNRIMPIVGQKLEEKLKLIEHVKRIEKEVAVQMQESAG